MLALARTPDIGVKKSNRTNSNYNHERVCIIINPCELGMCVCMGRSGGGNRYAPLLLRDPPWRKVWRENKEAERFTRGSSR